MTAEDSYTTYTAYEGEDVLISGGIYTLGRNDNSAITGNYVENVGYKTKTQ